MKVYRIKGGRTLKGEVRVSGAKNAALPLLAASLLTTGENIFASCPEISDVDSMTDILRALGCSVAREGETVSVNAAGMSECSIPEGHMRRMRSSVFLAGALLARCGEAVITSPGGCDIGKRPIDIHIEGLKAMGAQIDHEAGRIAIKAGNLRGTRIRLPYPSVGATENIILAATAAKGSTVIENSAREPEIEDLQKYINSCGGAVSGAGTGRIEIEGGRRLEGCGYRIMSDRIEAGTYMLMALGTGGSITLRGAESGHMKPLADLLKKGGWDVEPDGDGIRAGGSGGVIRGCSVSTKPYPGFPTDLHPQTAAFLSVNGKNCEIEENIFESRFKYAEELIKMGADIELSGKKVIIGDNKMLYGSRVWANDLRGGAALVIAGLMAEGMTTVCNTRYIKRGYGRLEEKIRSLGGDITEHVQRESD